MFPLIPYHLPNAPVHVTTQEALDNEHLLWDNAAVLDPTEVLMIQRLAITFRDHARFLAHYIDLPHLTC